MKTSSFPVIPNLNKPQGDLCFVLELLSVHCSWGRGGRVGPGLIFSSFKVKELWLLPLAFTSKAMGFSFT